MKNSYNIGIIVLLAAVVFGGYFLFKKPVPENQVPESSAPEENTVSLDEFEGLSPTQLADEVGEEVFEIFGHIAYINSEDKIIDMRTTAGQEFTVFLGANTQIFSYDTDNPNGEPGTFTPTGAEISLNELNSGEYIMVSSDENIRGEKEFRNIKFIQVSFFSPDAIPEGE